jgi:hydroxymethylglutaryl-CoA lyase
MIVLEEIYMQDKRVPVLPTSAKVEIAGRLAEAGFLYIECGSVVGSKDPLAQKFSDNAEVLDQLSKQYPKKTFVVLVPPKDYMYQRGIDAGFEHFATYVSANQEHNQANVGMTIEDSVEHIGRIKKDADERNFPLRCYIVTAFGYQRSSDVRKGDLSKLFFDIVGNRREGSLIYNVSFGDTFSLASRNRIGYISSFNYKPTAALHFHRNNENVLEKHVKVTLDKGITEFDVSLGDLGGCPTDSDRYQGNASTEFMVELMEGLGHETGIDSDKLEKAKVFLEDVIRRESFR